MKVFLRHVKKVPKIKTNKLIKVLTKHDLLGTQQLGFVGAHEQQVIEEVEAVALEELAARLLVGDKVGGLVRVVGVSEGW